VSAPTTGGTSAAGSRLEVSDLNIVFGGLRAVDNLSLVAEPGELFGVVGPNGAGKTTVLNAVSGLLRVGSGDIRLDGESIRGQRPDRITSRGVGRTFQAAEVFNELKVVDYLLLGRFVHQPRTVVGAGLRLPGLRRAERADRALALDILDEYHLADLADDALRNLPYGLRKLIDLLRAVLGGPRLLLLDEPTSGTAHEDRALLGTVLANAGAGGITTVVVDHDVEFVSEWCDRILVMSFGSELGTGLPREVLARPEVRAAYVGLED
jgi:branched-chain amino acid transport system ATP-binding protein